MSLTVVDDDNDDRYVPRDDDDLPFEMSTRIRLRDVIPCNLRLTHDFLQSSVETRYLETFAKCYGYLMYDRSRKLSTIRSTTTRARAVAQWLSEIEDIDTFRRTLHDHLIQTRSLLRDDMMDSLDLDDDIDDALKKRGYDGFSENNSKTGQNTESSNSPKTKVSGRELLRLARDSLDQILAFLRSEDYLRRAINFNGFFREIFVVDSSQARARVESAWNDDAATSLDANALLSIVLKDAILSTGLETHSTLLFLIRASLLFTFLVNQAFGRGNFSENEDDDPVNVARVFSLETRNVRSAKATRFRLLRRFRRDNDRQIHRHRIRTNRTIGIRKLRRVAVSICREQSSHDRPERYSRGCDSKLTLREIFGWLLG